jgi:ABC-type uncharacterized transport system substrate-binding protein
MKLVLKRLALGLFLIAGAAAVLLVSDWRHRVPAPEELPRVALFQFATRPLMDECMRGVTDALALQGFVEGSSVQFQRYSAENELPVASAIAHAIADGGFDLVITVGTPCLQAMAAANREGRVRHVFCGVTDPFGAGVEISREDPLKHPRHLVGIGSFQPVAQTFRLAKQLHPGLRKVGEVWNPAESNSEACTVIARRICRELEIELVEAHADSTPGVVEAANSLVSRGVQALWMGGDNTVELAVDSVVGAARKGRIPVFSNSPALIGKGVLFAVGADYHAVGKAGGDLAGRILKGLDPAQVPIKDVLPRRLGLNLAALKGLREPWRTPSEVVASAADLIDEQGRRTVARDSAGEAPSVSAGAPPPQETPAIGTAATGATSTPLSKTWDIRFISYVEASHVEEAQHGFFEEFRRLGLVEGRDYRMKVVSAQGDMATLSALIDAAVTERVDLVLLTSTPTLQAALQRAKGIKTLFTNVADPIRVGAGESYERHLPNVTGLSSRSAFEDMVKTLRECLPNARRIGTLYVPAEVNSVIYHDFLKKAAADAGLELISVAASTSSEVPNAASSLAAMPIDAVCQISDNTCDVAFPSIVQAARAEKKPLFCFVTGQVKAGGAAVSVARDYSQGGRDLANITLRVMRGESPGKIPMRHISKTIVTVNLKNAELCGLQVPASLVKRADQVIR